MKITILPVRFKVQYLRFLQNRSVKWRVVIISLLVFIFIIATFMSNVSHRPKTSITFVNENLCYSHASGSDDQRTAVIIVHSGRNNFHRRQAIRDSYATVRLAHNVQILGVAFMLGNSDAPGSVVTDERKLQEERYRFGDIVVGDFVDSYKNLTLKTIMAFEWVTNHCRKAQIVVKTMDDVFVNLYKITEELPSWTSTEVISPNIWCMVERNKKTINDKSSRYYASPVDFPHGIFPDHCGGLGYFTSIHAVDRILDEIRKSYPGRVGTHDDAFVTGTVRLHINSKSSYFWVRSEPIVLVNRMNSWWNLDLHAGTADEDYFLGNLIKNSRIETGSLNNFRRWYDKKVFYLISHSDDFSKHFGQLWKIVKEAYEIDSS